MNKENNRKILIRRYSILTAMALVVALIAWGYVRIINTVVNASMTNTVAELAAHDIQSISSYIELMWRRMYYIEQRFQDYDCSTIEEMQERLVLERGTSDFYRLYLVTEDGMVYSDRYITYTKEDVDFLQYFDGGKDQVVCSYDDYSRYTDLRKEMVLYGVRLDNFVVENIRFVAMVGLCSITEMDEHLNVSSFNGQGYSSIVDLSGNYLVNVEKSTALNRRFNLYQKLEEGTLYDGETVESIRRRLESGENFLFRYTDSDGTEKRIHFETISNTNLYFLSVVPREVFVQQNGIFIRISTAVLVAILLIGLAAVLYISQFRQNTIRIQAETKAKNDFLSNMSHEIRTPLNGLIGLNHLAQSNIDDREKLQNYLRKSQATAHYLLRLVNDVLDMAKLQSGKPDIVNAPMFVETMINAVTSMQHDNIQGRGVRFEVDTDISYPCVMGDEIRLKQVIMNIVGNAAKFTPPGGLVKLTVRQEKGQGDEVITTYVCSDTGCGMSEEFQKNIWDAFTQERNRNTNSTKGTGLGMAISYMLVKAMGGEIAVQSKLGEGSTFTVRVPSKITDQLPPNLEQVSAKTENFQRQTRDRNKPFHVLIAEDNSLNAEILTEILREAGLDVSLAENGRLALEVFKASEPGSIDCILMDMRMPEMDGCEATAAIRALDRADAKTVTIFACTANTMQQDRDRALESGMTDFMAKPVDVGILLEKLRQVFGETEEG